MRGFLMNMVKDKEEKKEVKKEAPVFTGDVEFSDRMKAKAEKESKK